MSRTNIPQSQATMNPHCIVSMLTKALLLSGILASTLVRDASGQGSSPAGILRKPIPEKLVVLTFDDGPLSGYTVVAPILKAMGFNGSFYVCDFDSFKTRKDWYMTWRQMKAMADAGFEIGNHSKGHSPALQAMLDMEDALLANRVPKPTTIAWPLHHANVESFPELSANGYTFARGGHNRPYRPTVDHPLEIPSMWCSEREDFSKLVRQATGGKIVAICYHGVPDMEHPSVSLDPEVFKAQMQYLKDNHYQAIALRDLAEYINPLQAAKLPPTARDVKESGPVALAEEIKPYVLPAKRGEPVDSPKPAVSTANQMLDFAVLPAPASVIMAGSTIVVDVAPTTDVTRLVPTFTLPPLARAVPASGTPVDFTRPQTYTVTAEDGSSRVYTVTVVKGSTPTAFTWRSAAAGNWAAGANWSNNLASGTAPAAAGRSDYVLNFKEQGAAQTVTHDLNPGFVLNHLILGEGCGGMVLTGNSLTFAANGSNKLAPAIHAQACRRVDLNVPVTLSGNLEVNTFPARNPNCFIRFNEVISGPGGLTLNSSGEPEVAKINFHDVNFGILEINKPNSYAGGTRIHGGKVLVSKAGGLGSGPVTLDNHGTLCAANALANPLSIESGTLYHCAWSGPIRLNGSAHLIGNCDLAGDISGTGGFTMLGTNGTYLNIVPGGTVTLHGTNTYSGPTRVFPGTLVVKKAAGLYRADPAQWTPSNIIVHQAATLRLHVGGPGEFTGAQVSALLANLTTRVNRNGLMEGCVLQLDTANATDPIILAGNIADSKGPGGGAFVFQSCGGGVLQLMGNNTYSGRTVMQGGTWVVNSFNSVVNGKAASSLGAPSSLENGIIPLEGDITLKYTGGGETTDRVMDLAGESQTVTLDQSGGGLLKFASAWDVSGYGHSKTLVLTGAAVGSGELAGAIRDPFDRNKTAQTALSKTGAGIWTLSGVNTFSGPTRVEQGTLRLTNAQSLSAATQVTVAEGATLLLEFSGEMRVSQLVLGGKAHPAGTVSATRSAGAIKGPGVLVVVPGDPD